MNPEFSRDHFDLLGLPVAYAVDAARLENGYRQLQSQVHRCPYCGSTDTHLENIFGPTPCRSLRYCDGCRQPFEQFKTI